MAANQHEELIAKLNTNVGSEYIPAGATMITLAAIAVEAIMAHFKK